MSPIPLSSALRRTRGFALIVTIVLVAFLVLILVGLATFTRVETQVASNSQSLAQARQNALMALNIAIGQLQKHTGPDQRVTATADVIPPAGHTWSTPAINSTAAQFTTARNSDKTSIEAKWGAGTNRHWTGAWKNQNIDPAGYDPDDPTAFNPTPVLQSWLVSGNENSPTGDAFKPADVVAGLDASSSPLAKLGTSARPYRLLVKASADVATSADLGRAVTAPEVPIRAAAPGIPADPVTGEPPVVGHYAWWVGDEGVKVRANIEDPHFEDDAARVTRFQSAQRIAVESMSPAFSALDPFAHNGSPEQYAAFTSSLKKVLGTSQLPYLPGPAEYPERLKESFHELTLSSRGVLADAKNGGLKVDLSYLFGQTTPDRFRTALRAAYGSNTVAPDNNWNRAFTPTSTPYATFPSNVSGRPPFDDSDPSTPGIFAYAATWEQLWSFANFGSDFTGPNRIDPRRQTPTQHGVHPLIIQAKLYYRLRIVGGTPSPVDGVNRSGRIWLDTIPVVLLANPYSVDLGPAEYTVLLSGSTPHFVFGPTTPSSETPPPNPAPAPSISEFPTSGIDINLGNAYTGSIQFVLKSGGIPAGKAHIFTIDPSKSVNPDLISSEDESQPTTYGDRIPISSETDSKKVFLKNDFDPGPSLTFDTGQSIPDDKTHVALRFNGAPEMYTWLYLDHDPAQKYGSLLLQYIRGQQSYTNENAGAFFIVDPLRDGIRQGGGHNLVLNQPPVSGVAAPNPASVVPQQAVFAQVNYRATAVMYVSSGGPVHPTEWATNFAKSGATGSDGIEANKWIGSNLLRPNGDTTSARWGVVNIGAGVDQTTPPDSIGGSGADTSPDAVGFINYLYDVPRPGRRLASLGQLQHFNTGGFIPPGVSFTTNLYPSVVHSWQNNYPLSNSYAHPRVPRNRVVFLARLGEHGQSFGYNYDGSFLWNDLLWDRFHFSTFPQDPAEQFDFERPEDRLVNSRLRPFRDPAMVPRDEERHFRGENTDAARSSSATSRLAAKNLLVEGAFNINSTSVAAWKALFTSLRNVPVGTESAPYAPFARMLEPPRGSDGNPRGDDPDSWTGFRDLTEAQIDALAEEMVMQVRKRGPFLSLSDFVNRRLISGRVASGPSGDPLGLGLSGALQTAIDRVTNQLSELADPFAISARAQMDRNAIYDRDYVLPAGIAGFPGHLLQADLLSPLGPALSARSDTFTIRTYGDCVNPATGEVAGRAWCEALVQRLPDYVVPETAPGGNAATDIAGLHPDNQRFGRRYQVVGFRWLSPEDI